MVIKAPIFAHYKEKLKTIAETDFSDYNSSVVFFQLDENKLLYRIAFYSKNLNLANCNYKIYNKKLVAINK